MKVSVKVVAYLLLGIGALVIGVRLYTDLGKVLIFPYVPDAFIDVPILIMAGVLLMFEGVKSLSEE